MNELPLTEAPAAATTVKICGLQSAAVLKSVLCLPVDQIGFVFAKSKRQLTIGQAAELIALLREERGAGHTPQAVGVFVDPPLDELRAVMASAPLDVIQLHGAESAAFCADVKAEFPGVRVFKVCSLAERAAAEHNGGAAGVAEVDVARQLDSYAGVVDAVLLDTFEPVHGGGSGKTFNWDIIPAYTAWAREHGIPLIVAGGLELDNVGDLIARYKPDGVDVSSAVETDGVKDIAKITAFVERVKLA